MKLVLLLIGALLFRGAWVSDPDTDPYKRDVCIQSYQENYRLAVVFPSDGMLDGEASQAAQRWFKERIAECKNKYSKEW